MNKNGTNDKKYLWKGPRLIVPLTVEAVVVTTDSLKQTWSINPFNFLNVGQFNDVRPSLLNSQDKPPKGITLHWALPDGFTHGVENKEGELVYPYVPNRWLVGRSGEKTKAWVLKSDYINLTDGLNQYLDPYSPEHAFTKIGIHYDLNQWDSEKAKPTESFLKAIGPGDPGYAAYTANIKSVFSFYDDMAGLENTAEKLAYTVIGWYADPKADPLFGQAFYGETGWTTLKEWETLMGHFKWTVGKETDLEAAVQAWKKWQETHGLQPEPGNLKDLYPAQTLCQGLVFDINWLGMNGKLQSGVPQYKPDMKPEDLPQIAIGNTAIDTLAALVEYELDLRGQPGSEAAQFLEAFQYNLLSTYKNPGGKLELDREIFNAWFGEGEGGTIRTIEDPNQSDPPILDPPLSTDLLALNRKQQQLDRHTRQLILRQQYLFGLWWKQGKAKSLNQWGDIPPGVTPEQWQVIQNDLKETIPIEKRELSQFEATIDQEKKDVKDLEDKIKKQINEINLKKKTSLILKENNNHRFHRPNDPVVLFYGAYRTYKRGEDGRFDKTKQDRLFCRFTGQEIYGIDVPVKEQNQLIDSSNIEIPFPEGLSPLVPKETADGIVETFFLDTRNAEAIAKKVSELLHIPFEPSLVETVKKLQTLPWNADAHQLDRVTIARIAGLQGTIPSLVGVNPWNPPWSPLYLAWEATWYPSYKKTEQALDKWVFNEENQEYTWKKNEPPDESDGITISGQSLLTPSSVFTLKAKLETYFDQHPDQFPGLKDFLSQVANWDFLSQAMGGLNDLLLAFNSNQLNPLDPEMKTLIGDEEQLSPNPSQTMGFYPIRAGHMRIMKLWVVDDFGQVFDPMSQLGYTPANFPLITARGMETEKSNLVRLPPRLTQQSRLLFRQVSAEADTHDILYYPEDSPICGWLLPNHLDRGIMIYDRNGEMLGEILEVRTSQQASLRWDPAPGSATAVGTPLAETVRNKHLRDFILALISRTDSAQAFRDLLAVIDETLWTIDPLGGRGNQNLSVLVGRPLALVRARLQYELNGGPYYNETWLQTTKKQTQGYEEVNFPVRLGSLVDHQDGLLGYFPGNNYNQMNSVHQVDLPPQHSSYIINENVDMNFNETPVYVTLMVDPRGHVNASSGILPVAEIIIPAPLVETPLEAMEVTFRTGPLISDPTELKMPLPAEIHGKWSWLQHSGVTVWQNITDLKKANDLADLQNKPKAIREGWLKLSGAIDKDKNQ
ncbi:MAG: hypothetical protein PVH61_12975 [Candidatus Aminicenantes bacterium]|jgi:hypothetical protein